MENEKNVTSGILNIDFPGALISYDYWAIQKLFGKAIAQYNIGIGHFSVMMSLYQEQGRSQDELASARGLDKSMIAKSVERLEKEGYVFRVIDQTDRRIRRLYLTEKGKKFRKDLEQVRDDMEDRILKDFDPEETRLFIQYLKRIAANLTPAE